MSVEAITWALAQTVPHSSAKFVLVVLANCASGDGNLAYPSCAYLAEATGQDRKTVLSNLQKLRDLGFITDSGKRVGGTKQVVVYQLNSTENGTVKQSQKRNSTENGTVPKTDGNSPVFPDKQSRFSAKQSQKRDTEPLLTVRNRKSNKRQGAVLPDWLTADAWRDWCDHRNAGKNPMTLKAAELTIRKLDELRRHGHDPTAVIENAIEKGWRGIYAPHQENSPGNAHGNLQPSRKLSVVEQIAANIADSHQSRHRDAVASSSESIEGTYLAVHP